MRRLSELVGFVAGCIVLVAAFGIGWANWGRLANQEVVMQTLMGTLVAVALLLAVIGILSKGKDKWRALTLDGVLLLGFSVLLFDVGLLFAPLGLFLFIYSLLKLQRA